MLVCANAQIFCTRDRGCSAHPAPLRPLFFGGFLQSSGDFRRENAEVCPLTNRRKEFLVVPAKAGTHTPWPLVSALGLVALAYNRDRWLWVPAFAGTTKTHVNPISTA